MREKVTLTVGEDWLATMEWPDGVEDGGPARLIIEPDGNMPVGGLSSTVLRQVDFRRAAVELRRRVRERNQGDDPLGYFAREYIRAALSTGVTDEYLALLSQQYVRAVGRGQSKINDHLAQLVDVPVSTVRGHLWQARNKGLLTRTPGRKGGEISEDAVALLEPYSEAWNAELERLASGGS